MKKNTSRLRWVAFLFTLSFVFLINGCSVWEDFTTYFNLYYNASDKFDEAEALILAQPKDLFQMEELKAPGNASQSMTQVIEKLSKLLQFYNKSGFVDNSLLMIGKAFYYQQDYIKAARKFDELITTFPEDDLILEAKLWLGKTLLRQNKYDEGLRVLDEVKEQAVKDEENEILTQALIQQISYYIYVEKYPEAVSGINNLTEISEDDEIAATAVYQLGLIYLELNELENASKAFSEVKKYSPAYEIDYKASLEYGKVQRRLGHNEEALEVFEDMKSEDIYKDFLDKTDLEIGLTFYELKRFEDAFNRLTEVDSTYKQTPSAGTATFTLGTIMEKVYKNFDSANVYYERAIGSTAPIEYIESARKKNQVIKKYKALSFSIESFKKQMIYLKDPDLFIQDSIRYAEEKAIDDSLAKERQELALNEGEDSELLNQQQTNDNRARRGNQNRQGTQQQVPLQQAQNNPAIPVKQPPVMPKITEDSLNTLLAKNEYELAGLFFTELEVPDSALFYYDHILVEHANTSYQARTLFALGTYFLTIGNKSKADSLFLVVYDNFKSESIVNAAAGQLNKPVINFDYDPAEELYVDAENKMKEEKFDQAISGFYYISDNYPKSTFAPKALYASGWILENKLKLLDSAAVVYDSVSSRFSRTQYASAVTPKLNFYKAEQQKKQFVLDSISNAAKRLGGDTTAIMPIDSLGLRRDSLSVPDTSIQNDPMPDVEQEEFTPDVPPPAGDSTGGNTGVVDTTIQMKPANTRTDSTRVNRRNVVPSGNIPGNTVPADSGIIKNRENITLPDTGNIKNKTSISRPDSGIIKSQDTTTPPDTTINENLRPR